MPTLIGTTQRLGLNQSSRVPTLEQLSGEKLVLWQGLAARVECALFNDSPATDSLVDPANLDSANIVVRKNGPNGDILFTEEITTFTPTTYASWLATTGSQFVFDISELDTTQIVPQSGKLPIYFVVTVTTTDGVPFIGGFGYGEIIDVGFIDNPAPLDYILGRTPIAGGKLLSDLDLNGYRLINSADAYTEEGEIVLAGSQLTVTGTFLFEKLLADGYRFDYLYIKDTTGIPRDVRPFLQDQTINGFTVQLTAGATAGSILYWKVIPKVPPFPSPSPAPRFGIVPGIGDPVYYRSYDRGGQFYNIMAYGGVIGDSDGTANDAAIAAILAEVGADTGKATIVLPGNLFCFASDIVLASAKNLIGFGSYYTEVRFQGTASLVLGTSAHYFNGSIKGLTVSRNIDFPNIPSGSTGIKAFYYQGAAIDDVMIATHDIGIKAGGNSSTQLTISNTTIFNIKSRSLWLQDAIQTNLFFVKFGRTGILNSPAVAVITISGVSDTIFAYGLFIGGSDGAGILWENSVGSSGVFFFDHITAEAIVGPFLSCDSATTEIKIFQLVNSRAQINGKLFDFPSTTVLDRWDISHNPQLQFFTSSTLRNPNNCTISANKFDGDLTIDAGSSGNGKIIGNTFTTTHTVNGAWKAINFDGNQFTFNGVTEINLIWNVTGLPGSISRINNVKDTGTPIPNIFPADTLQPVWTAATLPSSDGWINFGGSPQVAGYRKNRGGDVEIRGVIKNGTNTGGALLLPLLPVGYRPAASEYFDGIGSPGAIVRVESSGAVRLDTPGSSNAFLSLSGIRFTPA